MSTALFIFSLASIIIGIGCAVVSLLALKGSGNYFEATRKERQDAATAAANAAGIVDDAQDYADRACGHERVVGIARNEVLDACDEAENAAERAEKAAKSAEASAAALTPAYIEEVQAPLADPIFHFPADLERDCE